MTILELVQIAIKGGIPKPLKSVEDSIYYIGMSGSFRVGVSVKTMKLIRENQTELVYR